MVKIIDINDDPNLVLTNNKEYEAKNISHNDMSFILYYSNMCPACRNFHPIYTNFVNNLYKNNQKLNIKFYEISNDENNKHLEDAINVLLKHCKVENRGYIPHLLVFCKNKLLDSHIGGMSIDELNQFIKNCENKCKLM